MPKKKFIDKKNSVKFHLVHRSQHDPLTVDENAPQRVLLPATAEKSAKDKIKEEQVKYGIYFDDEYNYLQHLRDVNKTNIEWVETVERSQSENQTISLPSSVFASTVEEEVGLLNKAAPQSGLRLDLDPDVVAALDEDFDYNDPDNILEDNFIELANKSPIGSDSDEYDSDNEGCNYSDEMLDEVGSLKDCDTNSRFTDYSMTSSVISRNSQLTLLDETFEQMYIHYDDVEIGALECDEIEGELDVTCPMIKQAADEFEKEKQQEKLSIEDVNKLNQDAMDESDIDDNYLVEVKEKERWDCESILSTYSNIYNHPKLIKEPTNRIKIHNKTGMPIEKMKLTKQALSKLDILTNEEQDLECRDEKSSNEEMSIKISLHDKKIGRETPDEKLSRKKQIRDMRRERRMERKANSTAFKEEKKKLEKTMAYNRLNRRGVSLF